MVKWNSELTIYPALNLFTGAAGHETLALAEVLLLQERADVIDSGWIQLHF